jgi:hypothetical protein
MTEPTETARDRLIAYAATTRTVTADGLAPLLDAVEAEARATVPAVVPPADQTALRDRIAEAVKQTLPMTSGLACEVVAEAVLAVLPASAEAHRLALSDALGLGTGAPWDAIHDRVTELALPPLGQDPVARRLGLVAEHRATVLREEAARIRAHCPDHLDADSADGSWMACHCGVADDLERRLTVEAEQDEHVCKPGASTYFCPTSGEIESDCHGGFDQCCDRPDLHQPARAAWQDPTPDGEEAHPAEHKWAAELYDPLADEWVPGTRYLVRDHAVNALEHGRRIGPTWKDGTQTQRRLVRATTTYTVEPDGPAVSSGQLDTDGEA